MKRTDSRARRKASEFERAQAYVRRVPPAVQGKGGHAQLVRVLYALGDFGLSVEDAFAVLDEWNARCVPPFSLRELRAQFRSALRTRRHPLGCKVSATRAAEAAPPQRPDGVARLLAATSTVATPPAVSAWIASRGFAVSEVAAMELVFGLQATARVPGWASFGGQPWPRLGYQVVAPLYDAAGTPLSVRARRVVANSDAPKEVAPRGYSSRGLVLANRRGVDLLRGDRHVGQVVVAEGMPDWLAWSLSCPADAVFGVFAGAWSRELGSRIPASASVVIATDSDSAGDRYAAAIRGTLTDHRVFRWRPPRTEKGAR